jgi:hypothetical protein
VRAHLRQSFNLVDFLSEEDADDSSITVEDDSDDGINWRAVSSGGRESRGRIELRDAPAGRGTEITATIALESRNALRKAYDKLTQHDPRIRSRRALRRLKQLLETGEIATSEPGRAAPRGYEMFLEQQNEVTKVVLKPGMKSAQRPLTH